MARKIECVCNWILVVLCIFQCLHQGQGQGQAYSVFCHPDRFGIYIPGNMSHYATVTLSDPSCAATSNDTHITLSSSFSACDSNKTESTDYIVVSNSVKMLGSASGIISRGNITIIPFACKYSRSGLGTSLVSFQPKIKTTIEARESGFGNFTLSINMARTASFNSYYGSYPVAVEVNDRLYIEISLKTNNTDSVLLVDNCHATPSSNKNDATQYPMIRNMCPLDTTLTFHSGEIYQKKFSFLAFKFVSTASSIFLHCEVYLCHKSSKATRCTSGCGINKVTGSRKKRGIEKRDTSISDPDFTKSYALETGEIRGKVNLKEEGKKGASSASTTTIAMGTSIGILALGLVSILIIKTIRRMQLTVKQATASSGGELGLDNKAVEMGTSD